MAALEATVPDVPEDVKIQLQRTAFLEKKVCEIRPEDCPGRQFNISNPHPGRCKTTTSQRKSPVKKELLRRMHNESLIM